MKRIIKGSQISSIFVLIMCFCSPTVQWAADSMNITEVGKWEEPPTSFRDVAVTGNYAYGVSRDGLTVIDISTPALPVQVGSYPEESDYYDNYSDIEVKNNRAYIIGEDYFYILDISNPATPLLWGSIELPGYGYSLSIDGNYAYIGTAYHGFIYIIDISGPAPPTTVVTYNAGYDVGSLHVQNSILYAAADEDGVKILDVSTPTAPVEIGEIANNYNDAVYVHVSGNRLYVIGFTSGMIIYGISTPQSPVKLGEYSGNFNGVHVDGSNAYLWRYSNLTILDISTPAAPALLSTYDYSGSSRKVITGNNRAYIADYNRGIKIMDISDPSLPTCIGVYGNFGNTRDMLKNGNTLFIAREYGLKILDVSSPSSPSLIAVTLIDDTVYNIAEKGAYLYLTVKMAGDMRFRVYNVSNPANPTLAADIDIKDSYTTFISITGNYAYIGFYDQILVYDISVPGSPVQTTALSHGGYSFCLEGNNAYLIEGNNLKRLDISSPSSPAIKNTFDLPQNFSPRLVAVKGNYLYVRGLGRFLVYDISTPTSPVLHKTFSGSDSFSRFIVEGNYAYTLEFGGSISVLDISSPGSPQLAGYKSTTLAKKICAGSSYIIYSEDDYNYNKVVISRFQKMDSIPPITISRDSVNIAGVTNSSVTRAQEVWVNAPDSTRWSVYKSHYWIDYSRNTSSGSGKLAIRALLGSRDPGTYTGTLTVHNYYSIFDFQTVTVNVQVYDENQTTEPFGRMTTPTDYALINGSIPVTGWALDDIGVTDVKLFLDSGGTLSPIGDAVFVEDARPDVEQLYPTYPDNWRAGWGYMLLTHFLPGGGNGTYKIHAIATDAEENQVTLGTRTFICDNANAVKPFGAIDTPTQGGTASGSQFRNWGWALTPQPNFIPTDGATINVWVDGVNIGHPTYDIYREDIATLLPGYANSNGAVGHFYLDTTKYQNGVHTIHWTVTDSAGNADGVGSRYFTIINSDSSRTGASQRTSYAKTGGMPPQLSQFQVNLIDPLHMRKGFDTTMPFERVYADDSGYYIMETAELEPVEIAFPETCRVHWGFVVSGNVLKPLPIGSTLDSNNNKFLWHPGPGFVGEYSLVFMEEYENGRQLLKKIIIRIAPKNN
ncbi:MAG: hypothetical protein GY950_08225 [bacterium]|nr:hypothetical protein [bacterium]